MARDFLVRFSSDALLVIIGAAGRKDEVGVRVDETGKHHAPAKIELFRPASLVQRFDPAARADGRDAVSLHENRTIAQKANVAHRGTTEYPNFLRRFGRQFTALGWAAEAGQEYSCAPSGF